uniref:Rab-GAP TBC domain-containing protein n=1 Tax=Norrisiella sphaerica TaxID=552664 RepID=A0A7S2VVC8_9EUKA|mmetsp:Transcript_2313/g.3310  ORF Transcript_2313/g.3310 Transcript_2313/m.3310 type:complete len:535 (+) Transcript_2313:170-1774(+)
MENGNEVPEGWNENVDIDNQNIVPDPSEEPLKLKTTRMRDAKNIAENSGASKLKEGESSSEPSRQVPATVQSNFGKANGEHPASSYPPPKKKNTPLPPPPSQQNSPAAKNTGATCDDMEEGNGRLSCPNEKIEIASPDANERSDPTLREKRSWSVSDLAIAVKEKVNSMAEKAKTFFNNGAMDSPDVKEDEREAEEVRRKKDWLSFLDKRPTRANMSSSRVNRMCWKGIPGSIRGRAWKAIIGNELKITPELFRINLKRGRKLWEEQIKAAKIANALGRESKDISVITDRNKEEEDDDDASREGSMRIIQADIPRTFPQLKFFHKEGPLHEPLLEVLQAYVCYRPDVGYVQGMSYLAAILLLNMPTFDAFQCLANLLNQDIYFAFFRMDVDKMKTHLRVYQTLMKEKLPNLYKHFEEVEIKPGMYLYEWLLTIYSRSLPIDIAHRIWDNFLYHGQVFLFRTALGMLRLFEPNFLKLNFEDCLSILNRPPDDIDEAGLFENINRIQLTSKRFDRMVAKYMDEEPDDSGRSPQKSS